jgi:hypothetical protein
MNPEESGQRLHRAALTHIAKNNTVQGRNANDYNEDEYAAALEVVQAVVNSEVLQEALQSLGEPTAEDRVTDSMLLNRAQEILQGRGFFQYSDGKGMNLPSAELQLEAVLEAIAELGKPGELRKDLPRLKAEIRDRMIGAAVEDGRIRASMVPTLERLWDKDPEVAKTHLSTMRPDPRVVAFQTNAGFSLDQDSLEQHMRAEAILEAGGADKDDTGALIYDADEYAAALEKTQGR